MKTYVLLLEWDTFQTKGAVNIKTHIVMFNNFILKNASFMRGCGKIGYSRLDRRLHYNTAHGLCKLGN